MAGVEEGGPVTTNRPLVTTTLAKSGFKIFFLLVILLIAYLYLAVPFLTTLHNDGQVIFTLDDSYIHLAFARTFAESGTFGIRPGHPVGGSTAPLWTLYLVPPFLLGISPEIWAWIWVTLFSLLSFFLLYRYGSLVGLSPGLSLCLTLVYALYYTTYLSTEAAMEIPLANALMLLLFIGLEREWGSVSLFAIVTALILLRPEFFLLAGLLFIYLLIQKRLTLKALIIPILVLTPYHLWLWNVNGYPLPTTFFAKVPTLITRRSPTEYLAALSAFLFQKGGILPLFIPYGIYRLIKRRQWLAPAWALFLLTWFAMTGKSGLWTPTFLGNFGRYIMIIVPILFLAGLYSLREAFTGSARRRLLAFAACGGILYFFLMTIPGTLGNYRQSVSDMKRGDIRVARWIAGHVDPGALLGIHDVGAMGYYTRNPLLDFVGIISPEAISYRRSGRLPFLIYERKPDYLVFIRDWGEFLAPRMKDFPVVKVFHVPHTIIFSSDEIWICRTPWTRFDEP